MPVILDPTANLPDNLGALDVRDDNVAILARAGVPVAISTIGNSRRRARCASSPAWRSATACRGKALDAITAVPAQIYGLRDRDTLERGAAADVVVWSGDPLEIASRAEVVIIGGVVQSLETHQTRLLGRYRTLPVPKADAGAAADRRQDRRRVRHL